LKPRNATVILAEKMCRGELPHGKEAPSHQKPWTPEDEKRLEQLAEGNTPTRVIALKLGGTEDAVRPKASDLNIALKLTNQYPFEKILRELFALFDLDPKASFKIVGEQIDGAFTFDGTDYLLEGKWQQAPVAAQDLDALACKLSRKLDNTLGLYLSINGFSEDAVKTHSSGRRLMLLMDGCDLMAVLEGRIDLIQLLLRKRRYASQTGNILLRIHEIL
jgi:hypothetical protein